MQLFKLSNLNVWPVLQRELRVASSFTRERNASFIMAFLTSAAFVVFFSVMLFISLSISWRGISVFSDYGWHFHNEVISMIVGLNGDDAGAVWNFHLAASPGLGRIWLWHCLIAMGTALAIFALLSFIAARHVRRDYGNNSLLRV